MNKLMAIFFLLGALGGFGMAQRGSFQSHRATPTGAPTGETRTVYVTRSDRIAYTALGVACMIGSLYFIARIRRDDLRK